MAAIVGMAAALQTTIDKRADDVVRIEQLRNRLVDGLVSVIPGCTETVPRAYKVAGNAHVCIEGVESESLLVLLDVCRHELSCQRQRHYRDRPRATVQLHTAAYKCHCPASFATGRYTPVV